VPPHKKATKKHKITEVAGHHKRSIEKENSSAKRTIAGEARQLKERMTYKALNNQFSKQSVACLRGKRKNNEGAQPATSDEFREFWTNVIGVEGKYRPAHEVILKWRSIMVDKERPACRNLGQDDQKVQKLENPWPRWGPRVLVKSFPRDHSNIGGKIKK